MGLRDYIQKRGVYSILEFKPANGRWCLCYMETPVTKKVKVRAGYYDNGFWDTESEKAIGIEGGYSDDPYEVKEWMYLE